MSRSFFEAVKSRRSYYALSKDPVATDERIEEIVGEAVKHVPSSFNSQGGRVVILLGDHHDRLWDLTKAELMKIVAPEGFPATEAKIDGAFRSGYGSILYFEDTSVVEGLQQKFPLYRENFPVWASQSSAMLQFAIWTALEQEGFGATLQHYNPIIDEAVKEAWGVPATWRLIAQMPFGKPVGQPAEKEFQPLAGRVKLFK
ncbi:nitroreductase family protein [Geomonas sp. Red32]|uniref:nitroreductase family protein n=1 Tax=Geomonas sp. Red32 TaxID=2912856 RepID=UPI00202CD544|nr:nitroreductase family protein [Geomonas sp. Red32]MCM0080284.1 nitroreductase family protein [Geomonas sp. Red32]